MSIKKVLFLILFSLCFFACKNSSDVKLAYSDVETLKETVKNKESNTAWAKELEGSRLSADLKSKENIAQDVILNPDILKIIYDYQKPVYPEFEDFGKLDISKLDESTKKVINEFADKISKNIYYGAESFFSNTYIFNYVFFSDEFVNNWKENFNIDFPYTKKEISEYTKLLNEKNNLLSEKDSLVNYKEPEITEPELDENGEPIQNEVTVDPKVEEENRKQREKRIEEINKKVTSIDKKLSKYNIKELFTKWIIGEPFYGEKILQIPIRFYCNHGTVDVTLYLNKDNNSIYQITINRWEKV